MRTFYCKACNKLEQTDRQVNLLNCTKVMVDGVEHLACYLHPAAKPADFGGIPAMQCLDDASQRSLALLRRTPKC